MTKHLHRRAPARPFPRTWALIAMTGALGTAVSALAQQVPDAGSTLRQTEQERRPALPPAGPPSPPPADTHPARVPSSGPTLQLRQFRFEGNTLLTSEVLAASIASYMNRPVRLADLDAAAALVAQRYRDEGWLARVVIPPQEVVQGEFTFKVIEATYGGAQFSADTDRASLAVKDTAIVGRVEARQARGNKMHLPSLERGLLVANDLPGMQVAGSQMAGREEGQTDVLLRATTSRRVYGELAADNYGARSTGQERALARVGVNSPLGIGDQFDVQTMFAQHLQYGRLSASVPLGNDGLRLGTNLSALHYEVGTPEFRALEPRGNSRSASIELLYPLVRASSRNLYLAGGFEYKSPYNTTVTGVSSDYAIRNATLRLDGNVFDSLAGSSAVSTLSLQYVNGEIDLDGSPTKAADAATINTQGRFHLLRWRLGREQQLNRSWTVSAALSGQNANRNLDSAERLYLGGANGVRAYPVNEGGGTQGQMTTLELRWRPPQPLGWLGGVTAFYDRGRIEVNKNAAFQGAPALNAYTLSGYGLSVSGMAPGQIQFTAMVAWRIGSNPNPTATGRDQDGSLHRTRFWLSASRAF